MVLWRGEMFGPSVDDVASGWVTVLCGSGGYHVISGRCDFSSNRISTVSNIIFLSWHLWAS